MRTLSPPAPTAPIRVTCGKLRHLTRTCPSVLRMSDRTLAATGRKSPTRRGPICCSRSRRTTSHLVSAVSPHHDGTPTRHAFATLFELPPGGLASFRSTPAPTTSTRPTISAYGRSSTPAGADSTMSAQRDQRPCIRSLSDEHSTCTATECSRRIGTAAMTRCASIYTAQSSTAHGPQASRARRRAGWYEECRLRWADAGAKRDDTHSVA